MPEELPKSFSEHLTCLSNDIHKRFTHFMETRSIDSVYMRLDSDDFLFLHYAVKGMRNKEVAKRSKKKHKKEPGYRVLFEGSINK